MVDSVRSAQLGSRSAATVLIVYLKWAIYELQKRSEHINCLLLKTHVVPKWILKKKKSYIKNLKSQNQNLESQIGNL